MRSVGLIAVYLLVACGSSSTDDGGSAEDAVGGAGGDSSGAGGVPVDAGKGGSGGSGGTGAGAGSGATKASGGAGATGGKAGSGGSPGTDGARADGGRSDGGARCTPNTTLPLGAPTLIPGTWVNISPAGVPFDAKATGLTQGMALDPCDVGTLYLTVGSSQTGVKGLYKTVKAGASWTKIGNFDCIQNVRVDPRNPLHLYVSSGVCGSTMGFWVSDDGGSTWTMPDGFKAAAGAVGQWDVYHVEPDPEDFDHVLLSFHNPWYKGCDFGSDPYTAGVLETFDGGKSFTARCPAIGQGNSLGHNVFFLYDPAFGIGDDKTWLLGTQGSGYWRTTNAGTTWTKVSTVNMEHGGGQVYYAKSGVVYVSGNPHVIRSTDNGATWTPLATSPNSALSVIGDGTFLYSGNHGGGPYYTARESADQTWTAYNSQTFWEGPFEMAFDSANGILYGANIRAGMWALRVKP